MKEQILDKVLRSPRLPSLPTIALEVIELVQQQDVNIKHIANTIQHDPALSTKILKTVNSSFYGQAHTISTISHALVVLGLNSVKTLALGFSLVANLSDGGDQGFDLLTFWKRSLYSAAAARNLAKKLGVVQSEEAFLGGLLQDLGVLAMGQTLGPDYEAILRDAGLDHRKLFKLEQARLGTDHTEIGAALAEKWNLPPILVAPIRDHEEPDQAPDEIRTLVQCVGLGSRVADVFVMEEAGGSLDRYYTLAEQWFDIPREEAEPLLKAIHKDTVEMRRLFDLPTGELGNPDEILARAHEAMLHITLEQQQQQSQLEQQNKELEEQVNSDSLTGAANRRRFNEFISEAFEQTQAGGPPLSLLFLDTDHFKQFNDTYGHQLGDRVLVEESIWLKQTTPEGGLVSRYGGEEFAVVLPDHDRLAAARLAEAVRRTVEEGHVETDEGEKLSITVSVGVATYDGSFFQRVEQLIKAADQAVYAAKSAGRNCVRIFTPRPARKSA